MLRSYVYRGLVRHFINHLIGIIVFGIYFYLAFFYESDLLVKESYDLLNNEDDFSQFIWFFLLLGFMTIQVTKSYIIYLPSTYLSFSDVGISFKKLNRENKLIEWGEIEKIELSVEGEWFLSLLVKCKGQENLEVRLTSMWLLSLSRKWCVNYNFLKFYAIATDNISLMSKLDTQEIEEFKLYAGLKSSIL